LRDFSINIKKFNVSCIMQSKWIIYIFSVLACHDDNALEDYNVEQVSPRKWLVNVGINRFGKPSSVRVIRLISEEKAPGHISSGKCKRWGLLDEPDDIWSECFCTECQICCHFYKCQCQTTPSALCIHVHKVHMWTKKVFK